MPVPDPGEIDLLVERLRAGDREAFEMLVHSFEAPLFAYLNRFVGDAHSAEDLFQEVFLKVHTDLGRYRTDTGFTAWLYTLAHNLAVDWLRQHRKEEPTLRARLEASSAVTGRSGLELVEPPRASSADRPAGDPDPGSAMLAAAVGRLPELQRAVVCLRTYGELPFREIARVLDEPLGTVLGRMRLATLALRKELTRRAVEVKA